MRKLECVVCLWLAATHEAGIQTACADRVLFADPGDEALESQSVATVG
jgi:ABC-type polar amino acid transport system ATPase subunit